MNVYKHIRFYFQRLAEMHKQMIRK
jgi:hypothetical protein